MGSEINEGNPSNVDWRHNITIFFLNDSQHDCLSRLHHVSLTERNTTLTNRAGGGVDVVGPDGGDIKSRPLTPESRLHFPSAVRFRQPKHFG